MKKYLIISSKDNLSAIPQYSLNILLQLKTKEAIKLKTLKDLELFINFENELDDKYLLFKKKSEEKKPIDNNEISKLKQEIYEFLPLFEAYFTISSMVLKKENQDLRNELKKMLETLKMKIDELYKNNYKLNEKPKEPIEKTVRERTQDLITIEDEERVKNKKAMLNAKLLEVSTKIQLPSKNDIYSDQPIVVFGQEFNHIEKGIILSILEVCSKVPSTYCIPIKETVMGINDDVQWEDSISIGNEKYSKGIYKTLLYEFKIWGEGRLPLEEYYKTFFDIKRAIGELYKAGILFMKESPKNYIRKSVGTRSQHAKKCIFLSPKFVNALINYSKGNIDSPARFLDTEIYRKNMPYLEAMWKETNAEEQMTTTLGVDEKKDGIYEDL